MAKKRSKVWYENEQKQLRYWSYESVHDYLYYVLKEIDKLCRENGIHYYLAYGSVLGSVRDGGIVPWDPDADIYVPAQELKKFIDIAREKLPQDLYIDFYDTNPNYIYTSAKIGKKGFSTSGLHLDVFPLVGLPKGKNERKFLKKYEWQRIWFGVNQGHWETRIPEIAKICENKLFRRSIRIFRSCLNKEKIIAKMQKLANMYSIFDKEKCENLYDGYRIYRTDYFGEGVEQNFGENKQLIPSNWEAYLKQTYGDYMSYPKDRHFQSIIRSDYIKPDIKYKRTAYISSFKEVNVKMIYELEKLYWECGSIVALANVFELDEKQKKDAIALAKSLKYFDKVLVNDEGEEKKAKLLKMIGADNITENSI